MTDAIEFTDGELMRLMAVGQEAGLTAIYRRYQAPIYRFALLMSGSAALAEEVTQEVFLALIHEPGRYDPCRASLLAYLCGVARNQVRRHLERERPYVPLAEESQADEGGLSAPFVSGDDPLGNCTRNQLIQFVRRAVLALPARYREVVVLCDFQEMSYAEAATVLDCAIGTVNSRLNRGHALLLRKLRAAGKLDAASTDAQWMRCFV